VAVLVFVAVVACGGCNGSPTDPSDDYTGKWSGTTAQGKPFTFQVSGHTITTVSIGYIVQGHFQNVFGRGTCTADGDVSVTQLATTIAGTSFSYSSGSMVSSLTGSFGTATSASGSVTFTLTDSSSCAGTSTTTWSATKG
jgi:hypothetical protein